MKLQIFSWKNFEEAEKFTENISSWYSLIKNMTIVTICFTNYVLMIFFQDSQIKKYSG